MNVVLSALLVSVNLLAQTAPVKKLIDMETKANEAGERSNESVAMPHYEIPLRMLRNQKEFNLDPRIYQSLVFKKNGEDYVRWVVNPEDTKWYKDVEKFMTDNGLKAERKTYFKGYQTASRSYIAIDPNNGAQFSIKTSTNQTGGAWRDKKQDYWDGFDIMLVSDLMNRLQRQKEFENLKIMQEPLAFGIHSIDQSIVVRDLADLSRSNNKMYIPGFSVLFETVGRDIARRNGSDNPYEFWGKHYVEPMAKAAAEVVARTGIWFDSPHSQNFLVELDSNYRPTGKVVLRDLGDVYVNEQFMKKMNENNLLNEFSTKENIVETLRISFGPLHGNVAPSWIDYPKYNAWGEKFAQVFKSEFKKRTGIESMSYSGSFGYSYFGLTVDTRSQDFKLFESKIQAAPKWCTSLF